MKTLKEKSIENFFSIHNHSDIGSNQRLRDSTNKIPDMLRYAIQLGYKGLCLTEHESITSSIYLLQEFEKIKKEYGDKVKDFKVGLGNEIYLCTREVNKDNKYNIFPHFILLALDEYGHKGIRELSTHSWMYNCFNNSGRMNRIPTYYDELEIMLSKYKGHIIGSTACLGGALPRQILKYHIENNHNSTQLVEWIEYMNEIFGKGNFFLELQPNNSSEQLLVNNKLIELSKFTDTPYIITTDSHYLNKESQEIHKIFLQSQDGDREVDSFYETTYMMEVEEIHSYMDNSTDIIDCEVVSKGLANTMSIYDRIIPFSLDKPLSIPYIPLNVLEPNMDYVNKYKDNIPLLQEFAISTDSDSDRHLAREIVDWLEDKKNIEEIELIGKDKLYNEIQSNLESIKTSSDKQKVHWSSYLLQEKDYVDIAWKCDSLVGAGRGSGVGFFLLYLLGITQINPLRENTKCYSWRFLNPYRTSVLDIDVDICPSKRDIVILKLKETYGEYNVSKVLTMSTETTKSAILTSARGLGIDNDIAQYIASLVISDRGQIRTLTQMYFGDTKNGYKPIKEFVDLMNQYPKLWEVAQGIEGLVSSIGSHAGGVIITDKPFSDVSGLMRTNTGDVVTQFDLHKCEDVSLIKIDLLVIDALDKIQSCLQLLLEHNKIKWQGSWKDTYNKYVGIYNIERADKTMWEMLHHHKVLSFFQMEKDSGKQAIALSKPYSVDDLSALNSIMRLMPQNNNSETPLEKYARFKNDINEWYKEMEEYGLTQEEQDILKEVLLSSYGICQSQEQLMILGMHPKICGWNLGEIDRLRKAIAKKNPKEIPKLKKEFFDIAEQKQLSKRLVDYVWNVLFATQLGYSFNASHTLSYSLIGLQELNLNYKYNPIYWQTANLIVDSGALDENINGTTNYDKMSVAIAKIQEFGTHIIPPYINEANYGFKIDDNNNHIMFGFKGMSTVNNDTIQKILSLRPFNSVQDFINKVAPTKTQMFKLIQGNVFANISEKTPYQIMYDYVYKYILKYKSDTNVSLSKIKDTYYSLCSQTIIDGIECNNFYKYVSDDINIFKTIIEENKKMVKRGYHNVYYKLDTNSQTYFNKHRDWFTDECIVDCVGEYYVIDDKVFKKQCKAIIDKAKEQLDNPIFAQKYFDFNTKNYIKEYISGSQEHWSMQSLNYYYDNNEFSSINRSLYNISLFNELPSEPIVVDRFIRYINGSPKAFPIYQLTNIMGTIIQADNQHYTIVVLTDGGIVNVKFNKGQYSYYHKQVSHINNGVKTVVDKGWFKRGNVVILTGYRKDDVFKPKTYSNSIYKHTVTKVVKINGDKCKIQTERIE